MTCRGFCDQTWLACDGMASASLSGAREDAVVFHYKKSVWWPTLSASDDGHGHKLLTCVTQADTTAFRSEREGAASDLAHRDD